MRRLDWRPDLARLEALREATELNQLDYAESWLWVHFLLSGDEQTRKIVQNQMKQLIRLGVAEPMAESLAESIPDCESKLISHLRRLEGKSTLSGAKRPVNAIPVSDEAF